MSVETADRGLALAFRSPSPEIKIEFQGGEPLLNFNLIKHIVTAAEGANEVARKKLEFVIATNLALLTDEVLEFAAAHGVYFSTSLDGPADLHNSNRPRRGGDSWERAVSGIQRVRENVGIDRVSALMTTTKASLKRVHEIIDCYVELGFERIFLRPLSPFGYAVKTRQAIGYETDEWLEFYRQGLEYILELNAAGTPIVESYAALILKKMLTNSDPGYVDLMSPAGIGIAAIVYNYDGDAYASDEGRMLAEMGDHTFRLGNVIDDEYEDIMTSEALLGPLDESFARIAPMCTDCAFEPFCGSDPVYHHATMHDSVGLKPLSGFHRRNSAIFRLLLGRYNDDPFARQLFLSWAGA